MLESTVYMSAGVLLVVFGIMAWKWKKTDVGLIFGIVGAGLIVMVGMGGMGLYEPLAVTDDNGDAVAFVPGVLDGTCQVKAYTKLTFSGDTWGANDPTAPAGSVDIYTAGVNPSDSSANKLDTIAITSGVGTSTTGVVESCTNYGIIYNGASAEYDAWFNGIDYTQPNAFPYVSTTESAISNVLVKFPKVVVVATIPDPIEENSVTGIINGQTDVNGTATCSGEIQVGADATPADSDVIYYNKTNGDLSWYLDITLGADGANKQLHDPVLCFVNDHSNPWDGDELTAGTLTRQSGTDFGLPTDITDYINSADCVPMGAVIEGGQTAVYRLQFTGVNANLDASSDIMYIYPDDMGEYLGKDILRNTKATAGAVIEMQFRE